MKITVLDHGYVELIEPWGTGRAGNIVDGCAPDFEAGIIEAARQSTQGSFRGWGGECNCGKAVLEAQVVDKSRFKVEHRDDCPAKNSDLKLLRHLYTNNHSTPFEFAGMVIEVQAPLFVFREWHRHRTQSYNEMSARYTPLPDLYYEPAIDHVVGRAIMAATEKNKQAQSVSQVNASTTPIGDWVKRGWELNEILEEHYSLGLKLGVPKELARIQMPVGHYSRMRASTNLRNWLAFMTLRCCDQAQWEIRQYANAVAKIIAEKFPRTHSLWAEAWEAEHNDDAEL